MHQAQKIFVFSKDNYAFALWPAVFVLIFKRNRCLGGVYTTEVSEIAVVIRFLRLGVQIKIFIPQ